MSKCISMHGEYSDCAPDRNFICKRCTALDEDALFAKVERLSAKLAEKDEAIQVALRNLIANDAAMKLAAKQIAERDATIERVRAVIDLTPAAGHGVLFACIRAALDAKP